jgi:hypothetical protein
MPLSSTEAQQALQEISATRRASSRAYGYHAAAPHLLLWGAIWALGYGANYFLPQQALIWPVLVVLGIAGSGWFGWQSGRANTGIGGWRYAASVAAVFLFIAAVFAILPPRTSEQASAFFPVLVAFGYVLLGIWTSALRLIVAGVLVAALALGGFFWLPQIFLLWMAVVGGGALILGGLWFRSA